MKGTPVGCILNATGVEGASGDIGCAMTSGWLDSADDKEDGPDGCDAVAEPCDAPADCCSGGRGGVSIMGTQQQRVLI